MAAAIEQVASSAEEEEVAVKTAKSKSRRSAANAASLDPREVSAFELAHQIVARRTKQAGGHGADALAQLTTGGLTFFAPVDDAWNEQAWAQVGEAKAGPRLLGNHVRLQYSVTITLSDLVCRAAVEPAY
jgi:hypothetical protein